MMELTLEEKLILLQTLGLNYTPRIDKNFFGAAAGTDNEKVCVSLVEKGLMVQCSKFLKGSGYLYRATSQGRAVAFGLSKELRATIQK
jgi:hypothetical protein